jgi:hypothetical protein
MNVKPPSPARNLRSQANPSPSIHGGVNPSSTTAPPARFPRDGATTRTPDHCKKPQTSTTGEPPFHTVTGRNATPIRLATVAPTVDPHSQNAFEDLAQTDDESCAVADGILLATDEKIGPSAWEDGDSQPLLDGFTQPDDPSADDANVADVVILNNDGTSAEPALTSTNAAPAPRMALMMLMLHTMQNTMQTTNQAILTRLNTINFANKLQHDCLRAAINAKADSTKIARLD